MRFACQSCGKAYNLPEEKIADKGNVKLKCRVCGAIVEVKKQGEVVAALLGEGETKRGRVSEAPAPLTSMLPDDSDDATHAIAVSDQILSEGEDAASALMGHVTSALGQRGLAPLPPPSPTGFGSPPAAFGSPPAAFGSPLAAGFAAQPPPGLQSPGLQSPGMGSPPPPGFAPTPVPPPLAMPDLPRADALPPFPRPDSPPAPPLPPSLGASGPGSPPPPLPGVESAMQGPGFNVSGGIVSGYGASAYAASAYNGASQNGSNGAAPRFGDATLSDDPTPPPMAPVAMSAGGSAALSSGALSSGDMGSYSGPAPVDMQPPAQSDGTRKMLAALATGILIGFIIARLFF